MKFEKGDRVRYVINGYGNKTFTGIGTIACTWRIDEKYYFIDPDDKHTNPEYEFLGNNWLVANFGSSEVTYISKLHKVLE